jgi:threonine/homoserine/homoserine lactone efflux protein
MILLGIAGLALAMFLLAITLGPGVFATVSKALSFGFKHTVPVIVGIVFGDLIFLLFAIYRLLTMAINSWEELKLLI